MSNDDLEDHYEQEFLRHPVRPLTREQLAMALGLPIPEPEPAKHFEALQRVAGTRPSWQK